MKTEVAEPSPKDDPLTAEIERQRRELAVAEARLLDQLRHLDLLHDDQNKAEEELASLAAAGDELDRARGGSTNNRNRGVARTAKPKPLAACSSAAPAVVAASPAQSNRFTFPVETARQGVL